MIPDVKTSTLRDFTSAKELGHGWKNTFDKFQAMITIMKKGEWIGEVKGEEIGLAHGRRRRRRRGKDGLIINGFGFNKTRIRPGFHNGIRREPCH